MRSDDAGFSDEFVRAATQASKAFDQLRHEMKAAARDQPPPQPGSLIGGRYRVVRELGQGGFGSVYLVKHDMLGRQFAMKVLNSRIASDPDWVARFREEARATSLIGQENIVFVTDFGQDEEHGYYFVMEYLDGQPLDEIIVKEGPQPTERILRLAHAAASALGAVHELGIVHCDLKPSNIFAVARPGRDELWKFLDFGTSTVVMNAVASEALYGTPRYMAPEQSVGLDVDGRADQFSLGCIVYEMLTGLVPWDVRSWLQAMPEARKKRPPRPPSAKRKDTPAGWDEAVLRALSVEPRERFESIDEFARALESGSAVSWTPSVDPLDVRRSVVGGGTFERTFTAPAIEIQHQGSLGEPSSMVIDMEAGDDATDLPTVTVVFKTRDRLVREYRRNLAVGGLFVPSEDLLPLRAMVLLELELEPSAQKCRVRATVVGHEARRDAGRGFGLAIEPADRKRLDAFLTDVRGPAIQPTDTLDIGRPPKPSDKLSPGAGFVLSRIEGGIPLSRLKAMCAGLPFDIESLVNDLVERGLVVIGASQSPVARKPSAAPTNPQPGRSTMARAEIEAFLERVDFHQHQANYLAATDVLRKAIAMGPEVAAFHHRLAQLRLQFDSDLVSASVSARRAVELDPDNDAFKALLDDIRRRRGDL